MPQSLKVNKPSTFYIRFTDEMPKKFVLYNDKGEAYYFRYLDGKTPRIKFNIPDSGNYFSDTPFVITKQRDIEIPVNLPSLPPAERDRVMPTDFEIDYNYDSVAKNYTQIGLIVLGQKWLTLPDPMKLFILLHEKWHSFYVTEEYCDYAAGVDFLRMGYNRSTGAYALRLILSDSPQRDIRVNAFNIFLQKTQKQPL